MNYDVNPNEFQNTPGMKPYSIDAEGFEEMEVKKFVHSDLNIRKSEIETIDLYDEDIEINTINFKIDNIKKSNDEPICNKSNNINCIVNEFRKPNFVNAVFDKIKGNDVYTGSIKSLNVSSILNTEKGKVMS